MNARDELLREGLLALRDPLARIALATGELDAAPLPGEHQRQTEAVRSALAEADARLGELAQALAPSVTRGARETTADCRAVFLAVCARARVAAEARGIALASFAPGEAIPGDAAAVRRATLRALRAACDWAGASGALQIALACEQGDVRIAVSGTRSGPPPRGERARDLLVRFALAEGVGLAGAASLASAGFALELELPRVASA